MAVPAAERLVEVGLVAGRDVQEGGRSRAAVEVLVSAPDGEVGPVLVEPDLEHAGRVAQVPAAQPAHLVGGPGDGGEVPELAGAVVHRRVRGEDQVVADLGDPRHGVAGSDALDDETGIPGCGVGDVEVGGERVGVGEDDPPAGPQPRGAHDRLVEVHRRGVGADHLTRRGADEGTDAVTDPRRGTPPVGEVPARDEVVPPLAVHDVGHGLRDPGGQGAERVAVEVHHSGRQPEPPPQVGGGVAVVELTSPLGQR